MEKRLPVRPAECFPLKRKNETRGRRVKKVRKGAQAGKAGE